MTGRPRAVVAGTTFGRVYLAALAAPGSPFELAGVLARGSAGSRAAAAAYGLPLYRTVAELPDDVRVGCVAVRAGVVGGAGTDLAKSLLQRGIHVLQEQPLHPDELADCLRLARRLGVQYQPNPFYRHLAPVRRFLAAAEVLLAHRPALFLDATAAVQVAYPVADLLGRVLRGLRPLHLEGPVPAGGPAAFRTLAGTAGGVPLTVRLQNELDPVHPDDHAHLLFRLALGTEAGVLTLADAHGPVLWSPRWHRPEQDLDRVGDEAVSTPLGPAVAPSFTDVLRRVWPAGVLEALHALDRAVAGGADPLRSAAPDLAAATAWRDLTARMGPPDLVRRDPPRPLPAGALRAAVEAVDR